VEFAEFHKSRSAPAGIFCSLNPPDRNSSAFAAALLARHCMPFAKLGASDTMPGRRCASWLSADCEGTGEMVRSYNLRSGVIEIPFACEVAIGNDD
jgi:hypothetical protein